MADGYNAQPESDETNNTLVQSLALSAPDLAVSAATVTPNPVGNGSVLTVNYTVAANTDECWLAVANGNQHPAKLLAVSAVVHLGILSAIAIPNFVKARGTSQQTACINNLRQIDGAIQQWALENKKTESDRPTRADLKPYLPKKQFPVCPSGGTYTLGVVSDPPKCSHEGHSLSD